MLLNWQTRIAGIRTAALVASAIIVWPAAATGPFTTRVTQAGADLAQAQGTTRVTQAGAGIAQAQGATRVTQAGADAAQALGQTFVTQAGAQASQALFQVFVTQVGANIIQSNTVPPPPECPGVVEGPRVDGLPYVAAPTDPCSGPGDRGSPRTGA